MTLVPAYPTMSAVELRIAIAAGQLTTREVINAALEHIARREPALRAWQVLDIAGAQAAALTQDRGGALGLLGGLPLAARTSWRPQTCPCAMARSFMTGASPVPMPPA